MAAGSKEEESPKEQGVAPCAQPLAGQEASSRLRTVCLIVIFLSRLEVSVLTLVIPHIALEFGCSIEYAAWVNFLPAFAGTMFSPSVGKFSDMYGHASTWRASVLLLAFSTWLSAWSPSLFALLFARALTGFAGNGIMNPSLPLMCKGLSKDRRGTVQSYMSSVDALGSSTGVLFGGMLIDRLSWRTIFLVPAPFLTLMWLCSWLVVKPAPRKDINMPPKSSEQRSCPLLTFDWPGTLIFALMSFCLLFAINRGNDEGWGSPLVLGLFASAALLAPLLACAELCTKNPILPIWLFFTPARMLLTLTSAVTWSCYGSCFLLVPVYMQDALGMRAGKIGNLLTVRPIAGSLLAALMSRLIDRKAFKMRSLARCGAAAQLASYSLLNLFARLPEGLPFYMCLEMQLVLQASGAFGTGLPTNAMFVATLPEDQLANATAMRGVIIGFCSLCVQTTGLSLIRAMGSEFQPECYRPTWFILVCLQLLVVASTSAVPASAELGYTAASAEEADAEQGKAAALGSGLGKAKVGMAEDPVTNSPEPATIIKASCEVDKLGHQKDDQEQEEEEEGEEEEEDEEEDEVAEVDEEAAVDGAPLQVGAGRRKARSRAAKAAMRLGGKAVNGIKAAGSKVSRGGKAKNLGEKVPLKPSNELPGSVYREEE
mmetsp:Transcript_145798/g.353985  ORF Transcript_145798/g.353985 Transcript_145798/m.353985 type:complete len:656 (-) Transcript_145798:331-2298(-)